MRREMKLTIIILGIFLIGTASALSCCEKTKANQAGTGGLWCQQITDDSQCDTGTNPFTNQPYRNVPTACESTSYCKTGTCIDIANGLCTFSPQTSCLANGGSWSEKTSGIVQCQLGCCILGERTAFVTLTRCQKFSSDYNIETNFRADITDQTTCAASGNPSSMGACVYSSDLQKNCTMITKKQCQDSNGEFHQGYLCTAKELGTICGPSGNTICVEGKDQVYFKDTCGNPANIYDSSKIYKSGVNSDATENYWTIIQNPSCDDGKGNIESSGCGNCDYYAGSVCEAVKTGERIDSGTNICRDVNCNSYSNADEGFSGDNHPRNGETWCAQDSSGFGKIDVSTGTPQGSDNPLTQNLPGSRYVRKMCVNGEVITEPCQDYRTEVCVENDTTIKGVEWRDAVCRKNMWDLCIALNTSDDCNNPNLDCRWIGGNYYFTFSSLGLQNNSKTGASSKGVCVPAYAPGFDRTSSDGKENGANFCPVATATCTVSYTAGLLNQDDLKHLNTLSLDKKKEYCAAGGKYEANNCSCLDGSWAGNINTSICTTIGDCGMKANFAGTQGISYNVNFYNNQS